MLIMKLFLPNGYQNRVRVGQFIFIGLNHCRNVEFEKWAIPGHERARNDKGEMEWRIPDNWTTDQVRAFAKEQGMQPVFTVACVYVDNHDLPSNVPEIG